MFAGKHGFITPRDLFKWAGRGAVGYQELGESGYLLLAERLRDAKERSVVRKAIEDIMRIKVSNIRSPCPASQQHCHRALHETNQSPFGLSHGLGKMDVFDHFVSYRLIPRSCTSEREVCRLSACRRLCGHRRRAAMRTPSRCRRLCLALFGLRACAACTPWWTGMFPAARRIPGLVLVDLKTRECSDGDA